MASPTTDYYGAASGQSVVGGRMYAPSWSPSSGSVVSVSYSKGAHPSGLDAVLEEISPAYQSWNPAAPAIGPWGAGSFNFNSINSYCGATFSPDLRKIIGFGAGHAAISIPVPWAFDLETRSFEWLAIPVPSDGFDLLNGAAANASTVSSYYPTGQFNTTWADWQGDYSGWPSGYGQAGKVFPETGHSYQTLVTIPGGSYGNINGAVLWAGQPTGNTTGTDMRTSHFFDLDAREWVRCSNRHTANGSAAGGACHDPVNNKVFMFSNVSSTSKSVVDVLDVATKTWATKTASSAIDLPIESGGLRYHPSGLVLYFCPETSGGVASYAGIRHRIYAAKPSSILAGGWTWTTLTVSASSWPLHTDGTIANIGWALCPDNGCFYAINGRNASTTLWKLTPPSATDADTNLSGTWTVTEESFASGSIVSKNSGGTNADSYVYNRLNWDARSRSFLWFSDYYEAPVQAFRPSGL